jgi:FkbM family methyltransferase
VNFFQRVHNSIAGRWEQWRFRPHVIERHFAGEEFKFVIGDVFGAHAYGPQHERWPELEWIKAKGIRTGDTVVDCGANHGFSTLLFSRWTGPLGTVHAFEPNPHNMAILQENVRLNNLNNVACHAIALDSLRRRLNISMHPNSAVLEQNATQLATQTVDSVSLDEVMCDIAVDFIKIDVEGFELQVLRGARAVLAQRPRIDLELHIVMYENPLATLTEISSMLGLHRYSVDLQTDVDGGIRPFDNTADMVEELAKHRLVHLLCY